MNFSWHSDRAEDWQSGQWVASRTHPGVAYRIGQISLERRGTLLELLQRAIDELRFHEAGEGLADQLRAGRLRVEIQAVYLRWGLQALRHLRIDGEAATPGLLIERGPEDLCQEIAGEIRRRCGLTADERKN
jgi:hypothetical protein